MRQEDIQGFLNLQHLVDVVTANMVHTPLVVIVIRCRFKVSCLIMMAFVDPGHATDPEPAYIDHASESEKVDSWTNPTSMVATDCRAGFVRQQLNKKSERSSQLKKGVEKMSMR